MDSGNGSRLYRYHTTVSVDFGRRFMTRRSCLCELEHRAVVNHGWMRKWSALASSYMIWFSRHPDCRGEDSALRFERPLKRRSREQSSGCRWLSVAGASSRYRPKKAFIAREKMQLRANWPFINMWYDILESLITLSNKRCYDTDTVSITLRCS